MEEFEFGLDDLTKMTDMDEISEYLDSKQMERIEDSKNKLSKKNKKADIKGEGNNQSTLPDSKLSPMPNSLDSAEKGAVMENNVKKGLKALKKLHQFDSNNYKFNEVICAKIKSDQIIPSQKEEVIQMIKPLIEKKNEKVGENKNKEKNKSERDLVFKIKNYYRTNAPQYRYNMIYDPVSEMFSDYNTNKDYTNKEIHIMRKKENKKTESLFNIPLTTDSTIKMIDNLSEEIGNTFLSVKDNPIQNTPDDNIRTNTQIISEKITGQSFADKFGDLLCIKEASRSTEEQTIEKEFYEIKLKEKKFYCFIHEFIDSAKKVVFAFNANYWNNEKDGGFLTTLEKTDLSELMIESPCEIFKRFFFSPYGKESFKPVQELKEKSMKMLSSEQKKELEEENKKINERILSQYKILPDNDLEAINHNFKIYNDELKNIPTNSIIFFESKYGNDFDKAVYQLGRSFSDYRNMLVGRRCIGFIAKSFDEDELFKSYSNPNDQISANKCIIALNRSLYKLKEIEDEFGIKIIFLNVKNSFLNLREILIKEYKQIDFLTSKHQEELDQLRQKIVQLRDDRNLQHQEIVQLRDDRNLQHQEIVQLRDDRNLQHQEIGQLRDDRNRQQQEIEQLREDRDRQHQEMEQLRRDFELFRKQNN